MQRGCKDMPRSYKQGGGSSKFRKHLASPNRDELKKMKVTAQVSWPLGFTVYIEVHGMSIIQKGRNNAHPALNARQVLPFTPFLIQN
jgi:hypothetical protein